MHTYIHSYNHTLIHTYTHTQVVTTNNEITEEQRLAQKHSKILQGPGKLEDTDYDVLDLRPSELAIKVKEKRGAYALPKDPGQVRVLHCLYECRSIRILPRGAT